MNAERRREPTVWYEWPRWAREVRGVDSSSKLILMTLATYANDGGECMPGLTRLASDTGLSRSTLKAALGRLEYSGLVERSARYRSNGDGGRTSNLYRLAASGLGPAADRAPGQLTTGLGPAADPQEHSSEHTSREHSRYEAQSASRSRAHQIVGEEKTATQKQQDLIRDLYIHKYDEVPLEQEVQEWRDLKVSEATSLISRLYREVGRHGMYEGPGAGTPEYDALSLTGQVAADQGMVPGWTEEMAAREGWLG